jgi:hypothetical protein
VSYEQAAKDFYEIVIPDRDAALEANRKKFEELRDKFDKDSADVRHEFQLIWKKYEDAKRLFFDKEGGVPSSSKQ